MSDASALQRCAKCGHPRNNHHYRHSFVAMAVLDSAVCTPAALGVNEAYDAFEKANRHDYGKGHIASTATQKSAFIAGWNAAIAASVNEKPRRD